MIAYVMMIRVRIPLKSTRVVSKCPQANRLDFFQILFRNEHCLRPDPIEGQCSDILSSASYGQWPGQFRPTAKNIFSSTTNRLFLSRKNFSKAARLLLVPESDASSRAAPAASTSTTPIPKKNPDRGDPGNPVGSVGLPIGQFLHSTLGYF